MTDPEQTQPLLLFVDDEPTNLILLERVFSRAYRVMQAHSGQDALDMLAQAPFDLVLLDIMMPRMTGLQVLEQIRQTPGISDLPVILVSALADTKDVVRGLRMGANDYVTKPIEMEILSARVQTQLALKRYQDENKRAIRELQAAQEMRERFFRIASHDLKSPLTNICMIQRLLEEAVGDNANAHQLLNLLEMTTDRMQGVIGEFLDMAALEAGAVDLQLGRISVSDIIRGSVESNLLTARRKNIEIDVGETRGIVLADAARTGQALDNLVSNAIKYSPQDSTIRVWAENRDGRIRVFVADQGSGIPAEERDKLFTAFGKLSTRPTDGENSTGLGLWITKHLMTLQGGDVGVEPNPEGGSIFWLELSVAPASVPAAVPDDAPSA